MFLVFCLFISAFDISQPRDVDKMSDPPALYFFANIFRSFLFFSLCVSFPCRFLSISSFLLSTPCYFVILSVYFSMFVSHGLSVIFYIIALLISLFICILYYFKTQKFKKKQCLYLYIKILFLEKSLIIEHQKTLLKL